VVSGKKKPTTEAQSLGKEKTKTKLVVELGDDTNYRLLTSPGRKPKVHVSGICILFFVGGGGGGGLSAILQSNTLKSLKRERRNYTERNNLIRSIMILLLPNRRTGDRNMLKIIIF